MKETLIQLAVEGQVAHLTMARPHKRNALTQAMWQDLLQALQGLHAAPQLRLLVLRGAGGVFSAGADIDELTQIIGDPQRLRSNNETVRLAQLALQELPFASIAVVEGACVGGGCGLALACDFRLAAPDVQMAITPARLGLLYSVEDVRRVVNLAGPARARQLLLTGQKIDAATALEWGMLNEVVAADALAERLRHWSAMLTSASPFSVRGIKRSIAMLDGSLVADFSAQQALFEQAFSHADFAEGARAFLEKRAPRF